MHMPLHRIMQRLDLPRLLPDQEGCKVVLDHRRNGMASLAAGIGISRALGTVFQPHRGGDQLEMRVISVLCVAQDLVQRHLEATNVDGGDPAHPNTEKLDSALILRFRE